MSDPFLEIWSRHSPNGSDGTSAIRRRRGLRFDLTVDWFLSTWDVSRWDVSRSAWMRVRSTSAGALSPAGATRASREPFMAGALKKSHRSAVHMPWGPSDQGHCVRTVRGPHANG